MCLYSLNTMLCLLKKIYIMKMNILLGKTKKCNYLPTTYVCCVQAFLLQNRSRFWFLMAVKTEIKRNEEWTTQISCCRLDKIRVLYVLAKVFVKMVLVLNLFPLISNLSGYQFCYLGFFTFLYFISCCI